MMIFSTIRQWHRKRERNNILNHMPDHRLADIGYVRHGRKVLIGR
ncbi:MAG: DUF1127 domain-containing protein [Rhizobiales bacterium]|nr:DUF1127 domain-containing protein [Hyphomicrobiales bacterium]